MQTVSYSCLIYFEKHSSVYDIPLRLSKYQSTCQTMHVLDITALKALSVLILLSFSRTRSELFWIELNSKVSKYQF
jgi:hypothetical protein